MTPTLTSEGVQVVVVTDVICHLYLRWTFETPLKHFDAVIRRGMVTREIPRYCFIVYTDVEQEELSDTLTHTFILPDWPFCETRFFYFWGTFENDVSPSESPFFSYHRELPVVGEVIVPCDNNNSGRIKGRVVSHYECPNGAPPVIMYIGAAYHVIAGQQYYDLSHHTHRGVTYFDTTGLDPTKAILSGVFRCPWYDQVGIVMFNLCAVNGLFDSPPVDHNYCDLYYADSIFAFIPSDEMETGVEKDIEITPFGLSTIQRGGATKFGWRTTLDIDGYPNDEHQDIYGQFPDADLKLVLQIEP